jgi:hypothetical protein
MGREIVHVPTTLIPPAPLHPSLKLRMTKKASRDRFSLLTQGGGADSYREEDGYIYFEKSATSLGYRLLSSFLLISLKALTVYSTSSGV